MTRCLHVKQKLHDIALFHKIILSLTTQPALVACFSKGASIKQFLKSDCLSANKTTFEIGVNHTSCCGGRETKQVRLENGSSEKGRTPPEELPMGSGRNHPGPALYARVFFIAYLVFATGKAHGVAPSTKPSHRG